jgi:hypothetical protein
MRLSLYFLAAVTLLVSVVEGGELGLRDLGLKTCAVTEAYFSPLLNHRLSMLPHARRR